MLPRERFLKAVADHREPDSVPIDLGSFQSGIMAHAMKRLLGALAIDFPITIYERIQDLAVAPEILLQRFEIATRYVYAAEHGSREMPDINGYSDPWGIVHHKPRGVLYYEFRDHPLAGVQDAAQLGKTRFPTPLRESEQAEPRAQAVGFRERGYAVGTNLPGLFEWVMYLVGTEKFMIDMMIDRRLFLAYYERVMEELMRYYEGYLEAIAGTVDFVGLFSDFSSQQGPLFSPDYYRKYMKPLDRKWVEFVRKKAGALIGWHTCGASAAFFPDLIDLGVRMVNPVQVSAKDMDTSKLKSEFGKDLAFWGGIDTQRVLPFGTPADVRQEVKKRIHDLSRDGGYLLAPVHNIQADVPAENIIALYEAAIEFGKY